MPAVSLGEPTDHEETGRLIREMKMAQQEFAEELDGIFSDLKQLCVVLAQQSFAPIAVTAISHRD